MSLKALVEKKYIIANKVLNVADILASKSSMKKSLRAIEDNRKSQTKGPLEIHQLEDGRMLLVDGYHRFVEGLLSGQTDFPVNIVSSGYTDYWASPSSEDVFSWPKDKNLLPTLNRSAKFKKQYRKVEF